MDKRSGHDLLSNLPLSIIHAILEHVPIGDVVKTSILSRQWRYNWVTLPHLIFDDDLNILEPKDFINQVLLRHQGPIHKFKLDLSFGDVAQFVNQWLIFLSRNDIRMMSLTNYEEDNLEMHSSLYSCANLTDLEISHFDLPPPPPTFKGFSCLRCLVLQHVDVSSEKLQTILADQTLLEELRILGCIGYLNLRIHAPNLKILYYSTYDFLEGMCRMCLYAPLLRILSADFEDGLALKKSLVYVDIKILGGLTSLEELKGSFNFLEYLSIDIESCQKALVFPLLRFIQLTPNAFYDKKVESVLAHLSMDAPNLQKIKLSSSFSFGLVPALDDDSECLFDFTFERLKVIEVGCDSDYWMKVIKCLLARSPALETLICKQSPSLTDVVLLKQACTLLTYPRASTNSKILLKSDDHPCSIFYTSVNFKKMLVFFCICFNSDPL